MSGDRQEPSEIHFEYDAIVNQDNDCDLENRGKLFTFNFFIQVLLLLIAPIPGFDLYITLSCDNHEKVTYLMSDFLLAFMWIRLFFIVRTLLNYSIFTDAYARKLQHAYGF